MGIAPAGPFSSLSLETFRPCLTEGCKLCYLQPLAFFTAFFFAAGFLATFLAAFFVATVTPPSTVSAGQEELSYRPSGTGLLPINCSYVLASSNFFARAKGKKFHFHHRLLKKRAAMKLAYAR